MTNKKDCFSQLCYRFFFSSLFTTKVVWIMNMHFHVPLYIEIGFSYSNLLVKMMVMTVSPRKDMLFLHWTWCFLVIGVIFCRFNHHEVVMNCWEKLHSDHCNSFTFSILSLLSSPAGLFWILHFVIYFIRVNTDMIVYHIIFKQKVNTDWMWSIVNVCPLHTSLFQPLQHTHIFVSSSLFSTQKTHMHHSFLWQKNDWKMQYLYTMHGRTMLLHAIKYRIVISFLTLETVWAVLSCISWLSKTKWESLWNHYRLREFDRLQHNKILSNSKNTGNQENKSTSAQYNSFSDGEEITHPTLFVIG